MIELARHIEALLLKHNCVIVPHLGGFVTHYVPARHLSSENLYLPPHRSVGFNPQLTINDGLLVQSYMQAYDTNYPETLRLIENATSMLKKELQESGEFKLNGIGTLFMNMDGGYDFVSNEAGVLSPELYGLDAFNVECVTDYYRKTNSTKNIHSNGMKIKEGGRNYIFRINKELVNYAAAAIIAIIFYFAWATPISDQNSLSSPTTAAALSPVPTTIIQKPIQKEERTDSMSLSSPLSETDRQDPTGLSAQNINIKNNIHYFSIVLLSCVPQKNAEEFVEKLHEENLPLASVNVKRKMVRVLYGQYSKESEAYTELNKLRKANKHFSEAWVMEIN